MTARFLWTQPPISSPLRATPGSFSRPAPGGSRNGTLVNGTRLTAPTQLSSDDDVQLGPPDQPGAAAFSFVILAGRPKTAFIERIPSPDRYMQTLAEPKDLRPTPAPLPTPPLRTPVSTPPPPPPAIPLEHPRPQQNPGHAHSHRPTPSACVWCASPLPSLSSTRIPGPAGELVCPVCHLPQSAPTRTEAGTQTAFPDIETGGAFNSMLDQWCRISGRDDLSPTLASAHPSPLSFLAAPDQSWLGATLSFAARFMLRHALRLQTHNAAAKLAIAAFQVRTAAAPLVAPHLQHSAGEVIRAVSAALSSVQAGRANSPDAAALAAALDNAAKSRATLRTLAPLLRDLM
ncbi:MAG: FHA domain-containing protein [Phycisphaerales bacterium]